MDTTRTNKIILIVGKRGTGKTDFIKNNVDYFPQSKTLVVDLFDNPVWHSLKTWNHPEWEARIIPAIDQEKVKRHSTGIYRTFNSDIEALELVIDQHVRNCSVLMEDCSRWFNHTLTKTQKRYLLNCKQTNCDFYLFFHTLSAIPPELLKYADILVMFKTGEGSFDKKKFYLEEFKEKFEKVLKSKDKYHHEVIELQ